MDFRKDLRALGPPNVARRVEIALGDISFDPLGKFADTLEASVRDGLLRQVAEEALNQVHPTA